MNEIHNKQKEPNHKFKKNKNNKIKFDRALKERKVKYINHFKREHHCIICGEVSPCCLEFHHLKPEFKSFAISSAPCNIKITLKELKTEIRKCVMICSNCHKKLHSNELNLALLPEILNT